MSMVRCKDCEVIFDSDIDCNCFTERGVLCSFCRPEEEDSLHGIACEQSRSTVQTGSASAETDDQLGAKQETLPPTSEVSLQDRR